MIITSTVPFSVVGWFWLVLGVAADDMMYRQVELAQLLDESDDGTILEYVLPKKSRAPESITHLVRLTCNHC